ncbi:MAG: alkaline phosphatase, partial [Oxalobacteraceae bacterium]
FHYGDYIYEAPGGRPATDIPLVRQHIGPEPVRIDEYRLRYALYKRDPDLQAAHASAAFMMTYDDHEIDNNWAGDRDQDGTDPELFLIRRFAAMQAWYENMPVRKAQFPRNGAIQMFRRIDYGNLLRVNLLDTRQYRDDQICQKSEEQNCRDASTLQTGQILGDRQNDWLAEGLDGDRGWNLIAQQVVVMPYHRLDEAGNPEIGGDSWLGYPESRRKLVRAIQDRDLSNVVIATGDVHQNIVGYIPARDEEPESNQVATEFVCTSISSLGDGRDVKVRKPDWRPIIASNANTLFANGQRGYHAFTVTPQQWRTDIMKMDKVSDYSGQLSRLASFTIEKGSPLVAQG